MSARLVHRGPDGFGELTDGSVALAARRLAIVDPETGEQPIPNEDGTLYVVHDGEIYNHRELRWSLERAGHRFRTRTDTEVLLHLYEEHGEGFAARLRGMFAAALWDRRRQRLVLARDRFGIKPLSYRAHSGQLAFASELHAFRRTQVDLDALDAFLARGYVPAPLTIFHGVQKLRPGELLIWEKGKYRLEAFARSPLASDDGFRDDEEAELVEELRARLRDSVRAHLVTDAPVGIVLTGGTASAFVAALALEQTPGLRTFALTVDAQPDLAAIAEAFDEPFAAPAAAQAYLLAERAARQTKVVLCAAGGDDLFRPERPGEIVPPPLREELTGRPAAFEAAGNGAPTVTDGPWMAHSIEARLPYLDTVVTNLVGALPPRDRKRLLRKAAAPLLKRSRQPRATAPLGTWLREWLDVLSAETLNRQGFFRPDVVRRLIDEQVAGQIDRTRELWSLLTFTLWYERHVESAAPAEARAEVLVEGRP